jgi:hypothetical protein
MRSTHTFWYNFLELHELYPLRQLNKSYTDNFFAAGVFQRWDEELWWSDEDNDDDDYGGPMQIEDIVISY